MGFILTQVDLKIILKDAFIFISRLKLSMRTILHTNWTYYQYGPAQTPQKYKNSKSYSTILRGKVLNQHLAAAPY